MAMFCPNCGSRFDAGNFCRACGTALRAEQSSTASQARPVAVRQSKATILSLFSPVSVSNRTQDLNSRVAANIFGKIRIDLTARPLDPGETRLSVCSVAGYVRLIIPAGIGIKITGVSVFSRVELDGQDVGNNFISLNEYTTAGYDRAQRKVHIDVASIAGRINISR